MNRIALSIAATVLLATSAEAAGTISGRARVIDGNTITVEGEATQIRLFGIAAPKSGQSCQNRYGLRYRCGPRATTILTKIIGQNGQVVCETMDKDSRGRLVALCRRDGVDIGGELVRKGWARDYPRYSHGQYAALEAKAKAGRRGAWAGTWQAPWEWSREPEKAPGH